MQSAGSASARRRPNRSTREIAGRRAGEPGLGLAGDDESGDVLRGAEREHTADDLAGERGAVEPPFARDHEFGAGQRACKPDPRGDELEPRDELGPEGCESAGEPAGSPGPGKRGHIETELGAIALGETLQPSGEQAHLLGRRALLGRVGVGGLEERRRDVAGDRNRHAEPPAWSEDLERAGAAVRRRRAADRDDHPLGAGVERRRDQLARSARRRRERVVGRGRAEERRAPKRAPSRSRRARPRAASPLRSRRRADRRRRWRGSRHRARRGSPRRRRPAAAPGPCGPLESLRSPSPPRPQAPRASRGTCPGRRV